jgi:hypothetical protein
VIIFGNRCAVHREQAHSYRGTHFNCRSEPARDEALSITEELGKFGDFGGLQLRLPGLRIRQPI